MKMYLPDHEKISDHERRENKFARFITVATVFGYTLHLVLVGCAVALTVAFIMWLFS